MTKDTERALNIIAPIAKEFDINVKADNDFLYCNGQAIGIACNSTYATLDEFIGYLMMDLCRREHYRYNMPEELEKRIKLFWFSEEQVKELKRGIPNEGKV